MHLHVLIETYTMKIMTLDDSSQGLQSLENARLKDVQMMSIYLTSLFTANLLTFSSWTFCLGTA